MPIVDKDTSQKLLQDCLSEIENEKFDPAKVSFDLFIIPKIEQVFQSNTQSYREVLLGASVARHEDKTINLSKPYAKQGADAYNARSLDEEVINPFLQFNEIPCSKGPYLATFRRQVFLNKDLTGQRDQPSYLALVDCLEFLAGITNNNHLKDFIKYLLYGFIKIRAASKISIAKIKRLSIGQLRHVLSEFLQIKTGGLGPVLIAVALLRAKSRVFNLNWTVDFQRINQADLASGASGDITVNNSAGTIMVLEVTERPIDEKRVTSTFNTKIVKQGILDYLFIIKGDIKPDEKAFVTAEQYFSRGHELYIACIIPWTIDNLSTMGRVGREMFLEELINLIGANTTPAKIKVGWNKIIESL